MLQPDLAAHLPRIFMVRSGLQNVPEHPCPEGFRIRFYHAGDEAHWLRIHRQTEGQIAPDLFCARFGADAEVIAQRQLYVVHREEDIVGTSTGWWNDDFEGERWGRIHYVAVAPGYQNRGLGKALVCATCRLLNKLGHDRAYLATHPDRRAAIHLYRRLGFEPLIRNEQDAQLWRGLDC